MGAVWAFLFALIVAALLTELGRRVLLRLGWVDAPRVDRWHSRPIPRPGGPAIVTAVLLGIALLVPRPWSLQVWGLLAGSIFVFGVGLIDDLVDLANPPKLTLLIIAAAVPPFFGVTFGSLPAPLGAVLALLWVLAITNAMNWLDNMDGLTAGVSAIVAATLAILSAAFGDYTGSVIAALVAGACAAFLYFNFSPARIFMGDSGSGFLGLTLGVLALQGTAQHVTNVGLAVIVPLMILSIPIFDSAVVTLARLFGGRRLFQGGRDHPSHRLVVLGLSEGRAVLHLYTLSLMAGGAALLASRLGVWTGLVLAGALASTLTAMGIVLMRVRVYEEQEHWLNGTRTVLAQVVHKRRLLEMLLDLVLISVAYLASYLLRFEGAIPPWLVHNIAQSLPLVIGIKIGVLYVSGVYRGDWRYVGLLDLVRLARATALASLALVAVLFIWTRLVGYSRAAFIIDWMLTFGLLATMRVSIRLFQEYVASQRILGKRVLIAGAGQGGGLLLAELRNNPALDYRPVGFIDDDPLKQNAIIWGLPVLGSSRDIPPITEKHRIEEVLVAAPSMRAEDLARISLICEEAGVRCRPMQAPLAPSPD